MMTALSLLDWEGGHEGQILGEWLLLEPACQHTFERQEQNTEEK